MVRLSSPQVISKGKSSEAIKVLVEQIVPVDGESRINQKIMDFFVVEVAQYQALLEGFERRFTSSMLQDGKLRSEFMQASDAIISRGEQAVAGLEKDVARRVKTLFREAIKPWMEGNPFIERCLGKPRGYAGDYVMMDMGYDNQPILTEGLAGVFDRYFLDHYECVRQRKDKLRDAIRGRILGSIQGSSPMRMLSLGSGPCREWVDLERWYRSEGAQAPKIQKTTLTCLDKDPVVLAYGKQRLADSRLLESVEYVEADLFRFTRGELWRNREQFYDLVYGLGIANYFYDAMLENVIASAFTLVRPGGELMITHKDSETFNFPVADWLCDWVFLKRSAEEFSRLFTSALGEVRGQFAYRLEPVPNGEIFFGIVKRL